MTYKGIEGLEVKNGVLSLGRELFLLQENSGQRQFSYMLGESTLSERSLEVFEINIQQNTFLSEQYGFNYCHVIYPAKPYVYRSMFSSLGLELCGIAPASVKNNENVIFPDLDLSCYDSDDTHTNDVGNVQVLLDICSRFSLKIEDDAVYSDSKNVGDLGVMVGAGPIQKKTFRSFGNRFPLRYWFTNKSALKVNSGEMDFIYNPFAIFDKRLVLFGDSFFRRSLNIFSAIYSEVFYIRVPYILEDIVKTLQPDYVVTGNAERYLVNVPDCRTPKPYFLNFFSDKFNPNLLDLNSKQAFDCLFSGRYSKKYIDFKSRGLISFSSKIDAPLEIDLSDLQNDIDINACRDLAIFYEQIDIVVSKHLMNLALIQRPEGIFIRQKIDEYSELLK